MHLYNLEKINAHNIIPGVVRTLYVRFGTIQLLATVPLATELFIVVPASMTALCNR